MLSRVISNLMRTSSFDFDIMFIHFLPNCVTFANMQQHMKTNKKSYGNLLFVASSKLDPNPSTEITGRSTKNISKYIQIYTRYTK